MKPQMNRGVVRTRPMAGPQTYQRRSRFASQSMPKPPSAMPLAMETPLISPRMPPACAGPTWWLEMMNLARNWPMPFIAVAARAAPISTCTKERFLIRKRKTVGIDGGLPRASPWGSDIPRTGSRRVNRAISAITTAGMLRAKNHCRQPMYWAKYPPSIAPVTAPIGAPSQMMVVAEVRLAGG